ncbi:MAG TPA: alpha/beta hydrolase [Vicinamibacterales bacterium]|jgi:pimeloyl-ACP methyl ester carboxylesterase|nr:alpha/beta hydrolase [Vicinamibacterales bacterium]
MPTIELNDFEMYVEDRGAGAPLLLLHGGMGIGADWRHLFPEDPDGYRVIAPDLRGHGRSTNPSRAFTFRQCAQDVLALLDHLGLPTVKAIGMSMGAKTLLHVATARPSVVSAMVLISATPYFPPSLRTAAAQFTPDALDRLSDAERAVLRARHVHGDAQIAALYEMARGFATSYDDLAFTPPQLGTITARTLIVHGDRDPLYPVELGVELYRAIPQSALWVVPYGTHGPVFGPLAESFRAAALAHLSKTEQV